MKGTGKAKTKVFYTEGMSNFLDRFAQHKNLIEGYAMGVEAMADDLTKILVQEAEKEGDWSDDYNYTILAEDSFGDEIVSYTFDFKESWEKWVEHYKQVHPTHSEEDIKKHTTIALGYGPKEIQAEIEEASKEAVRQMIKNAEAQQKEEEPVLPDLRFTMKPEEGEA